MERAKVAESSGSEGEEVEESADDMIARLELERLVKEMGVPCGHFEKWEKLLGRLKRALGALGEIREAALGSACGLAPTAMRSMERYLRSEPASGEEYLTEAGDPAMGPGLGRLMRWAKQAGCGLKESHIDGEDRRVLVSRLITFVQKATTALKDNP